MGCALFAALALGCPDGDAVQSGRGPSGADAAPVRLARADGLEAIAAGGGVHFASFSHVCAVAAGGLQCWGAGESAQLGDGGMPRRSPLPTTVFAAGSGVTAVTLGRDHTCALVERRVHCWGANARQQSGPPRPYVITRPRPVEGVRAEASGIAAGSEHSCAITEDGVWCWGRNGQGQTGAPPCEKRSRLKKCRLHPMRVAGLPEGVQALALGRFHSCALASGSVHCWGDNEHGQLGDGATASRHTPAPVSGLPAGVTALVAGVRHSCALASGALYCWGANDSGQLGDGTTDDRNTPTAVIGLAEPAVTVAAGGAHTCAASAAGVHCWGDGREGQLDGSERAAANPRPLVAPSTAAAVTALAVGRDVSCALLADATVQCWGDNDFGQLGSGDAPRDHRGGAGVTRWDDGRLHARAAGDRIAVACLGDSNTAMYRKQARSWCDRLDEFDPSDRFRFVNRGEGGATAVSSGSLILAEEHLDYTIENDAVDAVVFAYGTNDLLIAKAEPVDVANAVSQLRQRARAAGVEVFVALTPPTLPLASVFNERIDALNGMLRSRFPADRVIDFWTGMTPDDFADNVHFNDSGQRKRARAAWEVLSAAAEPAVPR